MSAILEASNLTKKFGEVLAVDGVSVSFDEDEVCAVIGPNGAGKTTFFNLLTGSLQPTAGTITFKDEEITGHSAAKIARQGVMRSYQITQLFEKLTVLENVRIAVQTDSNSYNFWNDASDMPELIEEAEEVLEYVGLEAKADVPAANLSHGEQRTLEIAIALGTHPEILLLDEPSSGMSPEETLDVIDIIHDLADDFPIVLVEHKMSVVMEVVDRIVVLHNGQKIADGKPEDVRQNETVREVYIGE